MKVEHLGGNEYKATCNACARSATLSLDGIDLINPADYLKVEAVAIELGYSYNENSALFTPEIYMENDFENEDYDFKLAIVEHVAGIQSKALADKLIENLRAGEPGIYFNKD